MFSRKESKEQEARYVQCRKEEILANTLLRSRVKLGVSYMKTPSLKNVQFQDTDTKFPAPKMGAGMDFGVYKAYLLKKKPNPKYAIWTGKGDKEGFYIGIDIANYLKQFRATEESYKNRPEIDPEKDVKGLKHGNFENQPLDDEGDPIWTSEADDDTVKDEDDLIINYETIEQAVLDPKILEFPKSEQKYCWDEDFEKLRKQKTEKDEIIRNTLRSVINLSDQIMESIPMQMIEDITKITWKEEVVEYRYNREDVPCNIQPKRERKNLRNIVKEIKKRKKKRIN